MPNKPKRPCLVIGCNKLIEIGTSYCEQHKKDMTRRYDNNRGSSKERGYDARWRKTRETYLKSHPLCIICEREGKLVPATVVDHIKPHRGDNKLFWDIDNNWQALCKRHHDIKTAKEDGGYNNKTIF